MVVVFVEIHIFSSCFHATRRKEKLYRDCKVRKTENIYCMILYRKQVLLPGVWGH